MNRIDRLFQEKQGGVLSVYFTAGYPQLDDTLTIVELLDRYGADLVEIGMPFSDPVADGPVIQESSQKAIKNGMSISYLFQQLKELRSITQMPVVLMGYLNPVYRYGMDRFLDHCEEVGVDGLILPDFPVEEYAMKEKKSFEEREIHNILLISPQTPEERINYLSGLSRGFLYMVSSYSTTGVSGTFSEQQISYFERINSYHLSLPRLVGFGVSGVENFRIASKYAHGAIIGSAFIRALGRNGTLETRIREFMREFTES